MYHPTRRQKEILETIRDIIQRRGYAPSLEEIARETGLSSVATVHKHLRNLREKGLIELDPGRGRSVRLPARAGPGAVEVPLEGLVAAGQPIEAISTPETIALPESMIGRGRTFMLKVQGDSMIDEGILDGDLIIVESRNGAENGEMVVALVHGEDATVKRIYFEGPQVRLQPSNATLQPQIYPAAEVAVQGVVIGLLRKFR